MSSKYKAKYSPPLYYHTGFQWGKRTSDSSSSSRRRKAKSIPHRVNRKEKERSVYSLGNRRGAGKRGWKRLFLLVLIFAAGGLAWWGGSSLWQAAALWIAGTEWAVLKQVETNGQVRLPEADIINAAMVDPGANLMEINLDSISVRVMNISGIRRARAFRRLPGRLVIRVEERVPIAVIGNGELLLVDDEGATFPPVFGGEVLDLPVLTGDLKPEHGNPGFHISYRLIAEIKREYPQIYQHLGEINVNGDKLAFRLRQGGALVMGMDAVDPVLLENLETFLSQNGTDLPASVEYVDFRFPTMVITGTKG